MYFTAELTKVMRKDMCVQIRKPNYRYTEMGLISLVHSPSK